MYNKIGVMDPGAVPGISTLGGDIVSTNVVKIIFCSLWYLRTRPLKTKAKTKTKPSFGEHVSPRMVMKIAA